MTATDIFQRRLAVGLLGAFLSGAALLGSTPTAAADVHAGEIELTSQGETTARQFDTNGDQGGDRNEDGTVVPLLTSAALAPVPLTNVPVVAYTPTALDPGSSVQGENVSDTP